MDLVVEMLHAYPMQYIGVIGRDGRPKVKPFEFKYEEDGKLWFDVMKHQETYRELMEHPYVEITVADRETTQWIRIDGKVRFVDLGDIKTKVIASSPVLQKVCEREGSQNVIPFTLDEVTVEMASLDTGMEKRVFAL